MEVKGREFFKRKWLIVINVISRLKSLKFKKMLLYLVKWLFIVLRGYILEEL